MCNGGAGHQVARTRPGSCWTYRTGFTSLVVIYSRSEESSAKRPRKCHNVGVSVGTNAILDGFSWEEYGRAIIEHAM